MAQPCPPSLERCKKYALFTFPGGIGKLAPMAIVRPALGLIAIVGLLIGAGRTVRAFLFSPPGCEQRDALAQAASPDNTWLATLYYNVCSDGGFVTTISNSVEITRPNEEPPRTPSTATVFGMDALHVDESKPFAVTWTGPRHIEVTIPNDAWAGKQETAYADVTISYKYVPDDPIERTCLKQWRALPSEEMVRRSTVPDENIRAFLAKCSAEAAPAR